MSPRYERITVDSTLGLLLVDCNFKVAYWVGSLPINHLQSRHIIITESYPSSSLTRHPGSVVLAQMYEDVLGAEEKEIDVETLEQARNPIISGLNMRHFWGWVQKVVQR